MSSIATAMPRRVRVIDSHTGGEPTRVVIDGGPVLTGSLAQQLLQFRSEHDRFRSAVVNEPRGSDVMVGAMLTASPRGDCAAGVLFFNNVGTLGMCGHGSIGLVTTLAWLGRIRPGQHLIDTPVGAVRTELHADGTVTVHNVPAWRFRKSLRVVVEGHGVVTGDVAWGGNWFFLVADHGQSLRVERAYALIDFTWRLRQALLRDGITGEAGAEIDHIELFGPPQDAANHSRNFVLCPGKAYDRSPCGTGTSAKLACLLADGKIQPGEVWRQESITGSVFEGRAQPDGERCLPSIRGEAFINAEATLLLDPRDPLCDGIRA
jgi:4-hydroxyproline epimerase